LHAAGKLLNDREQRISGLPSRAQLPELPARVACRKHPYSRRSLPPI